MRRLLLMSILCAALISIAPPAFACSGIYSTPIENAMQDEFFVAAEVVDVDDVGINAILKVDRYFKGTGGEYLTVMRWPSSLQVAGHVRRYHLNCLYSGRHSHFKWEKGSYGYFPLSPNHNGTFRDHWTIGTNAHYLPSEGAVKYYSESKGERGGSVTLPVEEFEALLLRLSGQELANKPQGNSYPLRRFLIITTESGERYRLNPDRSVTWLDPSKYPLSISNDGTHVMFRLENGMLGFQYLALFRKPLRSGIDGPRSTTAAGGREHADGWFTSDGWLHPQPGLFGTFSPDSNFVAVQEASRLVIYLFNSEDMPRAISGNGYDMAMTEIGSYAVDWQNFDEQAPLVWSADSSTIAYQDSQGIWQLKIYDQVEPSLTLPVDRGRSLMDISTSGRYLRYGNRDSWNLLDVETGESWDNMLISPDESRLIAIRMELDEENAHRTAVVSRYEHCRIPLSRCPLVISAATPNFIFWHAPGFLGLVYSTNIESLPWRYSLDQICCCCHGHMSLHGHSPISAFAFDESYMQPAFAFEKTVISFGRRRSYEDDSVDLSEYLDSPIVDLEWGQPIFYEGR